MSKIWVFYILAVGISICSPSACAEQKTHGLDIVLNGGRVMDPESKFDARRNVGIAGGRIAVISEQPLSGKIEVNVTGLVVAPGFIDHQLDRGVCASPAFE